MSDDPNFAMDNDAPKSAENSAVSSTAAPMVLIEYRRGLSAVLAPPVLILLVALVVVSYQRQTPIRPISTAVSTPRDPAGPGRIIIVDGADTGAAFEPIVVRPETWYGPPTPATTGAPSPTALARVNPTPAPAPPSIEATKPGGPVEPEGAPSPLDLDPPKDLSPSPGPAVVFEAAPTPEPVTTPVQPADPPSVVPAAPETPRGQNMDDIRREAEEKAAEQKKMELFKLQARGRQLYETYRKAQESRVPFRNDLRLLVEALGNQGGAEINQLCEQYGRVTDPEIYKGVTHDLGHTPARMTRQAKVDMMRARGLPETMILDFLSRELHYRIKSRGGPRDQNEVRVLAAKLLLTFPIAPPPSAKSVAGVAPAPGPGAIRRPQ